MWQGTSQKSLPPDSGLELLACVHGTWTVLGLKTLCFHTGQVSCGEVQHGAVCVHAQQHFHVPSSTSAAIYAKGTSPEDPAARFNLELLACVCGAWGEAFKTLLELGADNLYALIPPAAALATAEGSGAGFALAQKVHRAGRSNVILYEISDAAKHGAADDTSKLADLTQQSQQWHTAGAKHRLSHEQMIFFLAMARYQTRGIRRDALHQHVTRCSHKRVWLHDIGHLAGAMLPIVEDSFEPPRCHCAASCPAVVCAQHALAVIAHSESEKSCMRQTDGRNAHIWFVLFGGSIAGSQAHAAF